MIRALAVTLVLASSSAFAGSVIVTNAASVKKVELCRAGGYAGCWALKPGETKGPDYVQTDRAFWLNQPQQSRTFSVTAENERYLIEEDFDGNLTMRFLP